ncbi:MAG: 9-O-acetylesterase [Candidatus Omnitrophica bacterium]|nr:9-O-acetylesterase [Candidatus Omnitrophota bacterium]
MPAGRHVLNPWLFLLLLASLVCSSAGEAPRPLSSTPRLSGMFSDHMVLQRDSVIPVWGWACPGEKVTATLGGAERSAVGAADGAWRVDFPPMPAGGPHELTVAGQGSVHLRDILIGDVWICAGQSNMEMHLRPGPDAVYNAEQEVASANYPEIRLLTIPRAASFEPQADLDTEGWLVCSPENVLTFSAAGYFFGREVQQHLGVPIGLINASKGSSPAEAWTSAEALGLLPAYKEIIEALPRQIEESRAAAPEYYRHLAEWEALLESRDSGQEGGRPAWAAPNLEDNAWSAMTVPEYWESAGFPDFDGVMWFRKEIFVPSRWVGHPLELGLCTINDMDRTYFNGVEVGRFEKTAGWTAPRVYEVSTEHVRTGANTVAVRVYDVGNKGGLCGSAADLWVRVAGDPQGASVSLAGRWRLKPGLDLKALPPKPIPPPLLEGNHRTPSALFNAMVAPMIPYGIRGVIWYQGESNISRAEEYADLFPALIRDWRARWGQGAFPFLYVQLASVGPVNDLPIDDSMSRLREAQAKTLALPNTAMAVTIDIGDPLLGHPRNKQEVGRRLAFAARRVAYGEEIVAWGPLYEGMSKEGKAIRIRFESIGGCLRTSDGGPLRGFAIAGSDGRFVWAEARIEGDSVVVGSEEIADPVAVRYAWSANPPANLINAEGFPAGPFRTDAWAPRF